MNIMLFYAFVGLDDNGIYNLETTPDTYFSTIKKRIYDKHKLDLERNGFGLSALVLYAPPLLSPGGMDDRADQFKRSLQGVDPVDNMNTVQQVLGDTPGDQVVHLIVNIRPQVPTTSTIPMKRKIGETYHASGTGGAATQEIDISITAQARTRDITPFQSDNAPTAPECTTAITLPLFSLPLQTGAPPAGFAQWETRSASDITTTTAFERRIDDRDRFWGEMRCIICGFDDPGRLQHCHIVPKSEQPTWSELIERGWLPRTAQQNPAHDPRNGILLCPNHRAAFDAYRFFIRFVPELGKFVFVHHSSKGRTFAQFHGKAVALDTSHRYAPFAPLFLIHEMRVRGFNPLHESTVHIGRDMPWQDWIVRDGVYDPDRGSFNRERRAAQGGPRGSSTAAAPLQIPPSSTSANDAPSGAKVLVLNQQVIDDILAATREMPTWKECVREGTSWDGTAEENIERYISSVGIEKTTRTESPEP